MTILKTQVDLIEVQLQYERYKCDQHVLRNRRLVGKVHKAQAFEDELNGLVSYLFVIDTDLSLWICQLSRVIFHLVGISFECFRVPVIVICKTAFLPWICKALFVLT